jgi:hypothetical protein
MALKILSQIGTDQGITSEAYLRIVNYSLSKQFCNADFKLQLFMSEADAKPAFKAMPYNPSNPEAKCQLIGDNLMVSFHKEIEVESECSKMVPKEVEKEETITITDPVTGESTTTTNTVIVTEMVEEKYPCTQKVWVCDLTPVEGIDIFQLGYSKLKEKMIGIFGEDNVVDC